MGVKGNGNDECYPFFTPVYNHHATIPVTTICVRPDRVVKDFKKNLQYLLKTEKIVFSC